MMFDNNCLSLFNSEVSNAKLEILYKSFYPSRKDVGMLNHYVALVLVLLKGVLFNTPFFILYLYMFNSKNDLVYGNLNKESLKFLQMDNIFTQYFKEFSDTPFNDLFATSEEIKKVINRQRDAEKSPKWKAIQQFIFQCDMDLDETLKINLEKLNIPFDDEYIDYLVNTSKELGGLVMQLKNHYQRPRPYQVAYYTNQPLHPFETQSGNTPSYPSGHAMQGRFLTKIISSHYPNKKIELSRLSEKISDSRIIMGVHYESDNKFGELIANKLLAKEDIKKRFDLD